jgi:undecaprenyl-diphosphatase
MIETLKHWDTDLFLFLNGINNTFLDFVMYWASEKMIWIPVYILFIYLIIKHYKKETWIIIPVALIMILISDQLSVLIKNLVLRSRPCHEPELQYLIHLVKNKCGGEYGFVSSHAVNHLPWLHFFPLYFKKK